MFPIFAQILAEVAPQGFPVFAHRLELMATEPVLLGNAPPECPLAFDGIIGRGVIRLATWFASKIFRRETSGKINLSPNVMGTHHAQVEVNAAVAVAFGDRHRSEEHTSELQSLK